MKAQSAYLHIPFCSHICYYCDFNKVFLEGQPVDEYIDRLIEEMALVKSDWGGEDLETIYIGGGTPSCLTLDQLDRLFQGIHDYLPLKVGGEFSMEFNPDDGDPEKFALMKQAGVNRISMGVQSFNDAILAAIGRRHRAQKVYQSIDQAREAGFDNLSIDLIFRLPKQDLADFEDSLDQALALDLPHYSIYSLILEQKTVFYHLMRQGKLPLPSQEEEALMFGLAMDKMEKAGRYHYEISNYAKPGFESRHNLAYWQAKEYLGLGAGAHGYLKGQRYQNFGPIQHYLDPLRQGKRPVLRTESISLQAQIEEYCFLGLRKMEGISKIEFANRFGRDFNRLYGPLVHDLIDQDLLWQEGDRLGLSQKGKYFGNEVFAAFLLDDFV